MTVVAFPSKRKLVVLCVDDEPTPLLIRRMVLEQAGFQVLTATTVVDALHLVNTENFDLVLTDYHLAESTGGELARSIKKVRPDLTVAIYSGTTDRPEDMEYADAFLTKAEGAEALIEAVRRLATSSQRAA